MKLIVNSKDEDLFSVGVYNGPAAVPDLRMFGLLQFNDAMLRE